MNIEIHSCKCTFFFSICSHQNMPGALKRSASLSSSLLFIMQSTQSIYNQQRHRNVRFESVRTLVFPSTQTHTLCLPFALAYTHTHRVKTHITMTTMSLVPSADSRSAGVQRLGRGRGVCVGEPVLEARPPEAAAPLEQPGDRLPCRDRWASDPQPARRQTVPGLWSSLAQDPTLEDW